MTTRSAMTALPEPVTWPTPGSGLWACSFRLGEWLPEPVTLLFADWLLPIFDDGFRAGMRDTAGASVTFPYATVNGWYYATPNPALPEIPAAIMRSRGRLLRFMITTVVLPGRRPVWAAPTLDRLYRDWHGRLLPAYRQLAATDPEGLDPTALVALVERVLATAGRHFWYLAVVGGAAWKIEAALRALLTRHGLGDVDAAALIGPVGSSADPAGPTGVAAHAVFSLDWFHPLLGERSRADLTDGVRPARPTGSDGQPNELERRCVARFAGDPKVQEHLRTVLRLARRFARIREEQATALTLGWPLLRRCAQRLGDDLAATGRLSDPTLLFFLTRAELSNPTPLAVGAVRAREAAWRGQRRLSPPLTIGHPPPLLGRHLLRTVGARPAPSSDGQGAPLPDGQIVGQPASPGRATGPVRVVRHPDDFPAVQPGDILVAPTTTPAWTPLFGRIVGVVTDRGTTAAHASILAREYGIPAVVATGDATRRLADGVRVTVDGSRGYVTVVDP